MLPPKKLKFRKHQKGRTTGIQSNESYLRFGSYAIVSQSNTRLRLNTIEAVRRGITRKLKRTGKVWVCVHPFLSVSAKPLEMRMGKGKGVTNYWACRIKKGTILYELDGISSSLAEQAYQVAKSKLPISTTFISWYQ